MVCDGTEPAVGDPHLSVAEQLRRLGHLVVSTALADEVFALYWPGFGHTV